MATPSQRGSALGARPLTRRASHVYGLAVAVAALGALSTGAGVLDVLRGVDVQSAHVAHLRVLGERLTAPAINVAAALMLPLAALGLVSVIQGMRSCVRQLVAQRRFLESLALTGRLPSHPGVWLVDDDRPQAFCAGHLRPRVYVSTGAVRLLGAGRKSQLMEMPQVTFAPRLRASRIASADSGTEIIAAWYLLRVNPAIRKSRHP